MTELRIQDVSKTYSGGRSAGARQTDPIGIMAIMNEMMSNLTIVEKNVRMFTLEGAMLWNRLLRLGFAFGSLALLYLRFRFAHGTATNWRSLIMRRFTIKIPSSAAAIYRTLSRCRYVRGRQEPLDKKPTSDRQRCQRDGFEPHLYLFSFINSF
ncbi:hypothetical protein [Runella sp.]|uniref:hypothetical protein n=1 Tax=Runella sp. TaxID=1960881 RepID=UPI003D13E448